MADKIYILCPVCQHQMETEPFKNPHCGLCDVTHESETLIEDIIIGTYVYRLAGKSAPGIVPDNHKFL